jgi:hypothetical protein
MPRETGQDRSAARTPDLLFTWATKYARGLEPRTSWLEATRSAGLSYAYATSREGFGPPTMRLEAAGSSTELPGQINAGVVHVPPVDASEDASLAGIPVPALRPAQGSNLRPAV